ncbi:hypothetical protein VTN00DRAFT_6241 [Thermoascus crustaceus]|uniref:uncharacterized protein n=1 Tax=Thermoascus crustaceus TaxID=5088 RepID=UPI003743123B
MWMCPHLVLSLASPCCAMLIERSCNVQRDNRFTHPPPMHRVIQKIDRNESSHQNSEVTAKKVIGFSPIELGKQTIEAAAIQNRKRRENQQKKKRNKKKWGS